jgi:hypothetical protein
MKKRHPKAVKVGRRLVPLPGVRSVTADPVTPTTKAGDVKPEKPSDEPSEELTRTIKKAYQ